MAKSLLEQRPNTFTGGTWQATQGLEQSAGRDHASPQTLGFPDSARLHHSCTARQGKLR
jgi:hypothetical protein